MSKLRWTLMLLLLSSTAAAQPVRVASKNFTESVILGEMITLLIRDAGIDATHRRDLGGTRILFGALEFGDIDVYPEYTGTIAEEILAGQGVNGLDAIRAALRTRGILVSRPLGFNNTYAMGMTKERAAELNVHAISDLRAHPELRFGFSSEFMERGDGWPSLRNRYALPQQNVRGLVHDIAYRALDDGSIDVMDLYSTDAKIGYYDLAVLEDDLRHFPRYDAVLLYRADLVDRAPGAVAAIRRLEGTIDTPTMIAVNAGVAIDKLPEQVVAAEFLAEALHVDARVVEDSLARRLVRSTVEHLTLVGISMVAAVLLAVPLGIQAARSPYLAQPILGVVGIIQTIPALALLVLLMVSGRRHIARRPFSL
ncbi:MAG: amino acid ABC transporter permease, partial [Planctomycetes bacterium]|nr:amino acid ABC transporter permease [Planctomycetota bacterium]